MKVLRRVSAAILTLIAALSLVATPVVASADDSAVGDAADAVDAAVRAAAPTSGPAVPGEVDGDEVIATAAGIETVASALAADGLVVTTVSADRSQVMRIDLPAAFDTSAGVLSGSGTVIYEGSTGDALAVQVLEDGSTRVQSVIESSSSAHEFEYGIDGYLPYLSDSGEAMFLDSEGDFVGVESPWAVDARGVDVPTFYEIRGGRLVQVVVPDESTVYPVVADPTWMWNGPAWGMKLNRSETSRVRDYAQAGSMCVAFSKGAPGVAIACGAFAGYMATQAALAESDKPKSCLFFTAAPVPGVIWRIKC